jgi:hypothetical protein
VPSGGPPYSHVGMAIKDAESLYLWDAPGDGGNCFSDPYASDPDNRIHGTPVHNGCRVSALDDVLGYYATVVDPCAQLVADSYMHMGLLEMEGYPPNGYSPAAFGMDDGRGRLPLVGPAALGAATPVEWDRPLGGGQPCPPPSPA